jgi:replicative DNA helicase
VYLPKTKVKDIQISIVHKKLGIIMTSPTFTFDDRFQTTIFELLITDKYFAEKCFEQVTPQNFKNEHYASIYNILLGIYRKYNAVPTKYQLRNELLQISNPTKSAICLEIFKRITEPTDTRDYEYVKKNLENFITHNHMHQMVNDIIKNQGDPQKAIELASKQMEEIHKVNFSTAKTENLSNITSILERSASQATQLIPTFMPTMDAAMGGGVPRATLTCGVSGTNVGKSIWLLNWAYHLINNGYKVLYVNLEGYEEQPMLRMITRALKANFFNVRWNRLTDYERDMVKKFESESGKNFEFMHNSSYDLTLEVLLPQIRRVYSNFKFDMLMVDYGQLIKTQRKFQDLRHEQAYVHRALATVCGELNVAGATVAQGTRDTNIKNGNGSALIKMTDISECFEIMRACATVFTLNRSEKDEEMELVRILCDKQRDGKKNIVEICKTDFSKMCFYGPETEGLGFINTKQYIETTSKEK